MQNQITQGQKLAKIAEGKWNPYYLAYAIETDAANPKRAFDRDGSNNGYFCWNNRRWDETCKREGINRVYCSSFVDQHLETLAALPKVAAYIEARQHD